MAVKNPKCLAIDTSVMLAAGGENAIAEESKNCRNFITEILKLGHHTIFTQEIIVEWDNHNLRRKSFVPKLPPWYTLMERKGLIRTYELESERSELRQAIFAAIDPNAVEVVRKDMRWVEGALLADGLVASEERRVRNHFRRAAKIVHELKPIVWVNPAISEEACILWLREGAISEEERTLGYEKAE